MASIALIALSCVAAAQAAVVAPRAASISEFSASPVEFTYPTPRSGFLVNNATTYPCGGLPVGDRTAYPLSGGKVSLDIDTLAANVNLLYANSSDPKTFHEFSTFANTLLDVSEGGWCGEGPDFGELGLSAGSDVTLLAIYQLYGNKTYFYHCADINLVEDNSYTAPNNFACSNSSAVLETASGEDSMVLKGSNFSAAQEGVDGQTVSIDLAAATAAVSSTASGSASASADASATSAATSAGASGSANSGAGVSAKVGGTGLAAALIGGLALLL
ncbi:uncharacterized protein I303_102400 [Kwoniella dejecticola CBS 10117]|uniref:Copper acquisition factor BIM1-like domain-containing protein n=1 Tax=Kwoniella dejecticola CBS 10117 TaxID=1296121 RepID=A0A1A6A8M3_9TREE|nr:uncharacterized protein I303_02414 [Kwoniella dejecticola CBS 10117]OBR86407.1 hypothetical protein I303_02414 [Kwoniella dejecticola CBS 10117]